MVEKTKDIDFPEYLDVWFNKYTGNAIRNERKKKLKSKITWITKRVVIFLIVITLGTFITTLSVDAYRVRVFNLITDIKEKYTSINIEREPHEYPVEDNILSKSYYPGYIPEGYKQSDIQNHGKLWIMYFENDNGDLIEFFQSEFNSDFQVDTEDANTSEIYVNGAKGILVVKEDIKTIFWFTETNNFYIAGKLEEKEILSMAESLEFIKSGK